MKNKKQKIKIINDKSVARNIVKEIIYPDHYIYTENDILSLAETANKTKSI